MPAYAEDYIKKNLEDLYDIQFNVNQISQAPDSEVEIRPENDGYSLFSVRVKFKNQLRLIIEVTPEKYAAFSIADMSAASQQKRDLFTKYAKQLYNRQAKTSFYINEMPFALMKPDTWPKEWNNYRFRLTKSPISAEDEKLDEAETAVSWSAIVIGMFLSLLNITEEENVSYLEGKQSRVEVNRYERNPVYRELCLASNGYSCKICGFDFEKEYGKIGHHFIHVHHIVPVSQYIEAHTIDPVNDLIPVCPNCHAMLHRKDPPYLPEEIVALLHKEK